MTEMDNQVPTVSWSTVEAILLRMATTEDKRMMVKHLVDGTRKQAPFLTPEGVQTELFYLAAALLDSSFSPLISDTGTSHASLSSLVSRRSRC